MHGVVLVLKEIGAGFVAEEIRLDHGKNLRRNPWFAMLNTDCSVDSSAE